MPRYSKESQEIRSKLALRFNTLYDCYEVYTTIHGSGMIFKWHKITDDVCAWYKKQFNLQVTYYLQPSASSGAIMEISHKSKPTEPVGT